MSESGNERALQRRLLIMACSQRKRPDAGVLPAIERYDGPQFKVLGKFLREQSAEGERLDTYILSAEYGLISGCKPILTYDRKMTLHLAKNLRPMVMESFKKILECTHYDIAFFSLGQNYWQALTDYEQFLPTDCVIEIAQGSMGRRQSELQHWLYGGNLSDEYASQPDTTRLQKKVRIRGVVLELSVAEIFEIARQSLTLAGNTAITYQSWYVQIDDQRVAPKWLVSCLTGLPVSAFHTGDARRVLGQLGIEVKRV